VALSTAGPVIFVDGELCNLTSKTTQLQTIPNKRQANSIQGGVSAENNQGDRLFMALTAIQNNILCRNSK